MLTILINAYACSPNMGSEPGMAWNWCVNLAKYCELYIITEGEFKSNIDAVLPTLPQGQNMHFYYNPVSDEVRKMCWNQGDWRFYRHYKKWQYRTYEITIDIIAHNKIDIVHQLNMIGFREPGYLWKIDNIPFVWGPVDAKDRFPLAYTEGLSFKQKAFLRLKNIINVFQLKFSDRVIKAANKAKIIIAASSETKRSFKKYMNKETVLINETGCYSIDTFKKEKDSDSLDLLWVGKLDVRKQLSLAIETIAKLNNPKIRLHIVGGGNQEQYKELANKLQVSESCIWYGLLPRDEVQSLMRKSDLLFFTSVAEGTPHVVLEAIGNRLPIICFDCCGQGDSVDCRIGRKVALTNPKQSINDFASIIKHLYDNRDEIKEMSDNCITRANELSWDNKARKMVDIYKQLV